MREFEDFNEFKDYIQGSIIENIAVQALDLISLEDCILKAQFRGCLFLGCKMTEAIRYHLFDDNYIFPTLDVPYNAYPNGLYTRDTLYTYYDYRHPETYQLTPDKVIYEYYLQNAKGTHNIKETLAKRLHDHSITDALQQFTLRYDERKVVAIMGGHGMSRDSQSYLNVAHIAQTLTKEGYLMISGGGPGAMEATHLGAWFADKTESELNDAFNILRKAPKYDHPQWLPTAFEVIEKYPHSNYDSLGIPTWHYGHEPPTPFATHIAKYFDNSVREEGLLAIAKGGIIFSPGSAGTIQEIFQDLAQNHYQSYGYASPMVFLDKKYWSYDRPIYPMIELMHLRGDLNHLNIGLYDDIHDVMHHIRRFTTK